MENEFILLLSPDGSADIPEGKLVHLLFNNHIVLLTTDTVHGLKKEPLIFYRVKASSRDLIAFITEVHKTFPSLHVQLFEYRSVS